MSAHSLTWQQIDTTQGEYGGPIIHLIERHAVQVAGRNRALVHNGEQLDNDVQPGDELLRICHRNGTSGCYARSETHKGQT